MRDRDQNVPLSNVVARLLVREVGVTRDHALLEQAGSLVFRKLHERVSLLTGSKGYRAILVRCLKLSEAEFRLLLDLELRATEGEELQGLFEKLRNEAYDEAEAIVVALLMNFFAVLVDILGSDLTWRIVGDIWPEMSVAGDSSAPDGLAAG